MSSQNTFRGSNYKKNIANGSLSPSDGEMKKNIVLIGFMGVGKGRTARMLAEKTGRFAVDCDDLIESFSNVKVKKIFAQFGEPRFRELEREVASVARTKCKKNHNLYWRRLYPGSQFVKDW